MIFIISKPWNWDQLKRSNEEWIRDDWYQKRSKQCMIAIVVKSDWSGRGSGGSTSGTRPFGQPLMLLSQESSSPSTSTPQRTPEMDQRGANKKRWRRVALRHVGRTNSDQGFKHIRGFREGYVFDRERSRRSPVTFFIFLFARLRFLFLFLSASCFRFFSFYSIR